MLVLVFGVEMGIMLTLPMWNPWSLGDVTLALVDAMVLTAVLSPALWFVVVRPLRELFDQRGRLLARVFEVQEQERARISRDLHDELGQLLTALLVGLRTIQQATDLDQAKERACGLSDVATESMDAVRRLAHGLRANVLEHLGLRPAVERLCEDTVASSGVDILVDVAFPAAYRFASAIEISVYRLLQEALTNIVKHAQSTEAHVTLAMRDDTLELAVRDNGRGLPPRESSNAQTGLGLQGMRERVSLLGGVFRMDSAPGRGTAILIRLPGVQVINEPHQGTDR